MPLKTALDESIEKINKDTFMDTPNIRATRSPTTRRETNITNKTDLLERRPKHFIVIGSEEYHYWHARGHASRVP